MLIASLSLGLTFASAFNQLHAPEAQASSYLKSNWNKYEENYHPNYLLDDNPKTAWVEGKDGDGVGEWVTIPVSKLKSAQTLRLVMKPGYQKSKNLLEANAAPKKLSVTIVGIDGKASAQATWMLERRMGTQQLDVPLSGNSVASVKFTVDEAYPGKVYKDLCISDLAIFVDSDVPYNKKAEQAKKQVALAWVKERVATAKYFAKLPKEYPFASTRFSYEPEPTNIANVDLYKVRPTERTKGIIDEAIAKGIAAMIAEKHAAVYLLPDDVLASLTDAVRWTTKPPESSVERRIERTGAPPRLPESIWLGQANRFLSLSDIVLTESDRESSVRAGNRGRTECCTVTPDDWVVSETTSKAHVVSRSDGSVERLIFTQTVIEEERVVTTTTYRVVLTYNSAGQLTRSVVLSLMKGDEHWVPATEQFDIRTFTRNDAGRITSIETIRSTTAWEENDNHSYIVDKTVSRSLPDT